MGRREGDAVTPSGGLDTERDRQVGLAGSRRSEEHDVVGFGEEVELGEVGDLLALDRALEGEVEVIEGLDLREPGRLHTVRAAVVLARGDLLGEHRRQVVLVGPGLLPGPLRERRGDRSDPRGLQGPRQERDVGCDPAHDAASTRASYRARSISGKSVSDSARRARASRARRSARACAGARMTSAGT